MRVSFLNSRSSEKLVKKCKTESWVTWAKQSLKMAWSGWKWGPPTLTDDHKDLLTLLVSIFCKTSAKHEPPTFRVLAFFQILPSISYLYFLFPWFSFSCPCELKAWYSRCGKAVLLWLICLIWRLSLLWGVSNSSTLSTALDHVNSLNVDVILKNTCI